MTRNKSRTEWQENHRSLTFVDIRISLSLLIGQFGHSIEQPWIGPPIVSAEWRINWPMWELKWNTDGVPATANDVDLKVKRKSFKTLEKLEKWDESTKWKWARQTFLILLSLSFLFIYHGHYATLNVQEEKEIDGIFISRTLSN